MPGARENVLEALNVSKVFPGGVRALCNVDLAVGDGETIALVGESGSGKTTLLRMFNRLEQPSSGEVRVRGRSAATLDPVQLRRQTGYVPQDGGLLPHWNVARNVELVPKLRGWSRPARAQRVRELLELVGLAPDRYGSRHPHELSGGQRQRVAFARALAADPDVILLDEPFGALDALTRLELQREFSRLQRRLAKTMVLVTHDLDEAIRLADRIAVLKDGRVRQAASAEHLYREPADEYVRELLSLRDRADA